MKQKIHKGFICILLTMFGVCVWIGIRLFREIKQEEVICQEIVELGGIAYDDSFLEEVGKIPGVRRISLVLEFPVQMRIGEYTMDTVWTGAALEEYEMKVSRAWNTFLGADPVLIFGADSLAGLCDANGHPISATKLREIMERLDETEMEYRLMSEEDTGETDWQTCKAAGVMSEPGDKILIMYEQARELTGENAQVHQILLTVQGEKQMERAKSFFP